MKKIWLLLLPIIISLIVFIFISCDDLVNNTQQAPMINDLKQDIPPFGDDYDDDDATNFCVDDIMRSWTSSTLLPPNGSGWDNFECWTYAQRMAYKLLYPTYFQNANEFDDSRNLSGIDYRSVYSFFKKVSPTNHVLRRGYVLSWEDVSGNSYHAAVAIDNLHILHIQAEGLGSTSSTNINSPSNYYIVNSEIMQHNPQITHKVTYRPYCLDFDTPPPPTVPNAPAINGLTYLNHPKIVWNAVSGATGYKIYKKDGSSNYFYLGQTSSLYKIDNSIILGYVPNGNKRNVYYKVLAYNSVGNSAFSNSVSYLVYSDNLLR